LSFVVQMICAARLVHVTAKLAWAAGLQTSNGPLDSALVDDHRYSVRLTEQTDKVPFAEAETAHWRRDNEWRIKWNNGEPPDGKPIANGRLTLSFPAPYGRRRRPNWSNGAALDR
jgi:hypothetical protein